MKNRIKTALLIGTALCFAGTATAQNSSVEVRLSAMEAEIAALRAELAAERSQTDHKLIELKTAVRQAPMKAVPSRSEDSVTIGGFIDFDAHVTDFSDGGFGANSIVRDFYIPGATPIGGAGTNTTDFTAQASRLWIDAKKNVNGTPVSARIEMDFLGSAQGNQRVSNSYSPRLRRAYVDFNGWRIGQEWSTFQNTSAIPESASFLALSDGMVFIRQPQIRYTSGNFQVALENGNATITPASGSGRIEADGNIIPDIIGRYNFKGDFGNVSLSAMGRQLRLESGGGSDISTFAISGNIAGRVKVGHNDDIRFTLAGGEGLGRYIGLNTANGAAINPVTGDLEAIPSYGGYVAYRHPFENGSRINFGVSALFVDNHDFMALTSTKEVKSAFAAYLFNIAPKVTLGGEIMYGNRENESGVNGDFTRFTFSTKYGF
ncbi:MAG: hypothetical protein COA43_01800 [Robiginitomaculum sp.]|nr:MAG: hypothetical protein COA43_01800 [Robiginitomaculum sp.]